MVANDQSFPDGLGFRCPVIDGAHSKYELRDSDVVRFRNLPPDRRGFCSLIETDENIFRLPMLATVELVEVEQPGTWQANGYTVERRCFTVEVCWG